MKVKDIKDSAFSDCPSLDEVKILELNDKHFSPDDDKKVNRQIVRVLRQINKSRPNSMPVNTT